MDRWRQRQVIDGFAGYTSPMLRRLIDSPWFIWLLRRRRYFGVASFGYAALHTAVYLIHTSVLAALEAYRLRKTAHNRSRRFAA